MDDVDYLASIAAQLIARIRDDDPEDVGRWLQAATNHDERWGLLFVLAAAVPDDQPWHQLIAWTQQPRDEWPTPAAAPTATVTRRPCGTRAAYRRHRNVGETPCPKCVAANREYERRRNTAA